MTTSPISIFWFRRDLRLHDNAGLYHALKNGKKVLPVFIFDTDILDKLEDKADRRVDFIRHALEDLHSKLKAVGSTILVLHGKPAHVFAELFKKYNVTGIFTNEDYEPSAIKRDEQIKAITSENSIPFYSFKDQVIFEKLEISKDDGKPYTVFTPYSKKWKTKLNGFYLKSYPTEKYCSSFLKIVPAEIPSLSGIGFEKTDLNYSNARINEEKIKKYSVQRDFPAIDGTTKLSVHLRFGTVSIRELARTAQTISETWLNELIWRDFYMMILSQFPHAASSSFKPQYDSIGWRNDETEFRAWCRGETGYPIVDAGMRELNQTGFMHNRVRMIVASFLVKHLLIDWRWGEAYFAAKLDDYDLSANNGGWQWAAGSGCDAAPYFRIFNPYEQTRKFDPELKYIRRWIPEYDELNYVKPIVDHKFARDRALETYKKALRADP
jgi:deoxyribodipyrimidine photo-lyase